MIVISFAFWLLAHSASSPKDCGLAANRKLIEETERLVTYREPLRVPVPETASGTGRQECARLEFKISKNGAAENIILKESTNDMLMNMAAADALRKYKFKPAVGKPTCTYSRAFKGVVGAAPPYP
jgi:TonB family protein